MRARAAMGALLTGNDVVCDMPIARNYEEALEVASTVRATEQRFAVCLPQRLDPHAQALKKISEEGGLGKVYHAYTRWTCRDRFNSQKNPQLYRQLAGRGVLVDIGIQRIDLALWLMGNPDPVTVCARTSDKMIGDRARHSRMPFDVEDFAGGFIQLGNGATLIFESCWMTHQLEPHKIATRIMGDAGCMVHRDSSGDAPFQAVYITESGGHQTVRHVQPKLPDPRPAKEVCMECMRQQHAPVAGIEDALRLQRIIDAVYKSARDCREVPVEAP